MNHGRKNKKKTLDPARLADAVQVVAMLGGYLNRDGDAPPGCEVIWRGFSAFNFIDLGYRLAIGALGPD